MPGDGDTHGYGAEDQLVAEIIPLRRRAPQRPDIEQLPGEEEFTCRQESTASACNSTSERSVWEPPSGELRRRGAARHQRAIAARRAIGHHAVRWLIAVVALLACATLVAALVVMAPPGHSAHGHSPQTHRNLASRTSVQSARRHMAARSSSRGRRTADSGTSRKPASSSRGLSPTGSDSASNQEHAAGSKTTATPAAGGGQASVVRTTPAAQPEAASASTSNSTASNECVPGELGC